MNKRSTIFRYIRFQIIELAILVLVIYLIRFFIVLPDWLVVTLIAAAVLKDIILYFFTWRSYVVPESDDAALMTGKTCVAAQDFTKQGRVRFNGELWKAELENASAVIKGETLSILRVNGLQLIVEKVDAGQ